MSADRLEPTVKPVPREPRTALVPCEGSHHPAHYLPGVADEMGRLMCKVCGQTFPIPNGDLVAPEHHREAIS